MFRLLLPTGMNVQALHEPMTPMWAHAMARQELAPTTGNQVSCVQEFPGFVNFQAGQ